MYQARLRHGVPLQIMIPDGLERSRKGAIYLQVGEPTDITDDEATHIKSEMDNPKTGLGRMPIVLEKKPEQAEPAKEDTGDKPATKVEAKPKPAPKDEAVVTSATADEEQPKESQPKGGKQKRRKR